MQFHTTKTVLAYLAMSLVQLPLISACVSSSHRPESIPPSVQQESVRVTKISNLPATDASYHVQFVTSDDCFLTMPKGIWKSIDGGRTWEMIHRAPGYWETIDWAYFFNTSLGWMKTNSGWFKSEDGGQTWQPFVTPLSSSGSLRDVKFINRNTGWIGGAALRPRSPEEMKSGVPRYLLDDITGKVLTPTIYRTDDGGKTWQIQMVRVNLGDIEHVSFIDSDHGIALSGPDAFFTKNGGKTWLDLKDPQTCIGSQEDGVYEGQPSWVYLLDPFTQWIVFDDGRMLRTTDGGKKWVELEPCDQNRPVVVHFSSENHGFGLGSDKFFYETKDGGKQWAKVGTDKYASLSFLNNQHVWLVSERGLFRISLDQ